NEAALDDLFAHFKNPVRSAVADLSGLDEPERERITLEIVDRLDQLRMRTSRPHWIIIDQAGKFVHSRESSGSPTPAPWRNFILSMDVTSDRIDRSLLSQFDVIAAESSLKERFGEWEVPLPELTPDTPPQTGPEVVVWLKASNSTKVIPVTPPPK